MTSPRIVFAGTPGFALASLQTLVGAGKVPVAVLTQPDRKAGRGRKLTVSPVKRYAAEKQIPILQPLTLEDEQCVAEIRAMKPDILVVAAYGLLLPQSVLDIPRAGCVNVHASLLPRWRGAAPIQAAILAGDTRSGVCLMKMTAGLDSGPVYACEATEIAPGETAGQLHDRLAMLGAGLLLRELAAILRGELRAEPQEEQQASYAGKFSREDARIDWQVPADEVERRVRAFNPTPGAYFLLGEQAVKCWTVEIVSDAELASGVVAVRGKNDVIVGCATGAVRLVSVQRPGRGRISGAEFARQLNVSTRCL